MSSVNKSSGMRCGGEFLFLMHLHFPFLVTPPERSGHSEQSSYQLANNNNLGVKETMYWKDYQERELATKLVPRHLEKYRERNCRLVGTALTP
jgi:hypothetical protein